MLFQIPILCFIFVLLESSGPRYGATSEAFIFSLNNSEGLAPFFSKVKPGMAGKAIDRHSFYGPKFGQDLVILLKQGENTSQKQAWATTTLLQIQ